MFNLLCLSKIRYFHFMVFSISYLLLKESDGQEEVKNAAAFELAWCNMMKQNYDVSYDKFSYLIVGITAHHIEYSIFSLSLMLFFLLVVAKEAKTIWLLQTTDQNTSPKS